MLKMPLIITLICEIFLFLISQIFPDSIINLFPIYRDGFRSLLFSGFLTVGSFLFAVQAFIIIRLKESIFDQDWYQEEHIQDVIFHDACIDDYLIQLKNLTSLLFLSILFSVLTALMHLSIGLYPNFIASLLCISLSFFSFSLILFTLIQIKGNFDSWLKALDKIYRTKLQTKELAYRNNINSPTS